ncbi:putative alanine--tRNA ligase [Martiniozyma asiatica (nom. inval.)]|nr:putative alanine--tRNA ligase [Martiniozyma asiatica]
MSAVARGTLVGALACQKDAYLKSFSSTVLTCTEIPAPPASKKKKGAAAPPDPTPTYKIELQDTILFPEGGGQPCDFGELVETESNLKIKVFDVQRENLKAIHYTHSPLTVGSNVSVNLDWRRRLDNMQQHTGQHLLSAILDKRQLPTLSWNMGEVINYLEIPRKLSNDEIKEISQEVNDQILSNCSINVEYPDANNNEVNEEKGIMRVVHIGDLDANPCCGTHLLSTGHIKAIVLLNQFSGKAGTFRINFICGDRTINYTSQLHETTKKLMNTLSVNLEDLDLKASQTVQNLKKIQQRENNLMKELASLKANELKNNIKNNDKKFIWAYRADAELDFINNIFKELGDLSDDVNLVLFTGETGGNGAIIISGPKTNEIADKLKTITNLRGGGKGKFQGKVAEWGKSEIDQVLAYLEQEKC